MFIVVFIRLYVDWLLIVLCSLCVFCAVPLWMSLFLYYFSSNLDSNAGSASDSAADANDSAASVASAAARSRHKMPRNTLKWLLLAQLFVPLDIIHR